MTKKIHTKIYQAFGLYSGLIYSEGDYIEVRRLLNECSDKRDAKNQKIAFVEPLRIVEESERGL